MLCRAGKMLRGRVNDTLLIVSFYSVYFHCQASLSPWLFVLYISFRVGEICSSAEVFLVHMCVYTYLRVPLSLSLNFHPHKIFCHLLLKFSVSSNGSLHWSWDWLAFKWYLKKKKAVSLFALEFCWLMGCSFMIWSISPDCKKWQTSFKSKLKFLSPKMCPTAAVWR